MTSKGILERRACIVSAARSFFEAGGFLEVETPVRMRAPIPERNIDAVESDGMYLATSPEPHMKRLLAAGHSRIFQISKCFRRGERGARHNTEFTMLEWYRTGADYRTLISDVQDLVRATCKANGTPGGFVFRGERIDVVCEWEVLTLDDAWARLAGHRLESRPEPFEFDRTIVEIIEPNLGRGRPAVLCDYPATFCPMSKTKDTRPDRAERLEIYIAGMELANGCTELTDASAQLHRMREEETARRASGKDVYPWPAGFAASLSAMPPCAGMALGIDRLVMLLCDVGCIDDVVAFVEE